jgi:hypothetical protein
MRVFIAITLFLLSVYSVAGHAYVNFSVENKRQVGTVITLYSIDTSAFDGITFSCYFTYCELRFDVTAHGNNGGERPQTSLPPIALVKKSGSFPLKDVVEETLKKTPLPIKSPPSYGWAIPNADYYNYCLSGKITAPNNSFTLLNIPGKGCVDGVNPFIYCETVEEELTLDHGRIPQGSEDIKTATLSVKCDKQTRVRGRLKSFTSNDDKIDFAPGLYTKLFVNDQPGVVGSAVVVNGTNTFTIKSHMYSVGADASSLGTFSGSAVFSLFYD